jgi:NADH:ubiquinone oxidoreductase subunit 3 (subunit A)
MAQILILPPLCFIIVLFTVWGLAKLGSMVLGAPKATHEKGKEDSYACGEVYTSRHIEPDYGSFFRFAVFFTIIDVAGLMVATLAAASFNMYTATAAVAYVVVLSTVLAILYSK